MPTINYWAVLVAGIASMVVGSLWYSPLLFGNAWMRLSGLSAERLAELKAKGMGKTYALGFLTSLIMAYVLAHFVGIWDASGVAGAFQLAFWIWLGFIATKSLGSVLWEGKPYRLYFLNISHDLISIFVMALILTFWR